MRLDPRLREDDTMILSILFFISLLFGQLGALNPIPGVYLYVHDIVLGVLLLFSFRRFRNSTFRIQHSTLFWPIIAFLVSCLVSLVANAYRLEQATMIRSFLYIARWGYYAILYFIVAKSEKPMLWLKGLYFTGVGFAVLGLAQFVLYPNLRNLAYLGWDPHYYRAFSTLLDPNFVGIIMVLTLFLGVVIKPPLNPVFRWILTGIVGIAFLLTFSRSSILALLSGLGVWVVYTKQWKRLWIAALIIGVVILIPKPGGDNLSLFRQVSSLARIDNWRQSMALIASSPLVGHGFYALKTQVDTAHATAYLDNSLLFVFATTGILGLMSYLWLLTKAGQLLDGAKEKSAKHLRIVGLMSLAALIVHSMFVNSLFYAWTMIWGWIVLGTCDANMRMHANDTNKKRKQRA